MIAEYRKVPAPPAGTRERGVDGARAGPPTIPPTIEQRSLPFADAACVATGAVPENPHLKAARKLSRRMKRLADRSPEQTRAGLAICRHLKALLASADPR